jgi:hypothetical protein
MRRNGESRARVRRREEGVDGALGDRKSGRTRETGGSVSEKRGHGVEMG